MSNFYAFTLGDIASIAKNVFGIGDLEKHTSQYLKKEAENIEESLSKYDEQIKKYTEDIKKERETLKLRRKRDKTKYTDQEKLERQEQALRIIKLRETKKLKSSKQNEVKNLNKQSILQKIEEDMTGQTGSLMLLLKNRIKGDPTLGPKAMIIKAVGLFGVTSIFTTAILNLETLSAKAQEAGFWSSKLLEEFNQFHSFDPKDMTNAMDSFLTMVDFRRTFGSNLGMSKGTIDSISNYTRTMGLAREESLAMFKVLDGINKQSVEFNDEFIKSIFIGANLNKVAFRDVMADITNNADYFSQYMSDSEESMKNMLLKTRSMGIEFATIAKILSGFTEVESTVEKQLKSSMFFGKNFDFMSIAQAQFEGDIPKATNLILEQLRGIPQEQMTNPFLKKQLADTLGLSVSELTGLYKRAKDPKVNKIETEYLSEMQKLNDNINSLGLTYLKDVFTKSILVPLNNFVTTNTNAIQNFIKGVGSITEIVGKVASSFFTVVAWLDKTVGFDKGILSAIIFMGTTATIANKMLSFMSKNSTIQTSLIRDIYTILKTKLGYVNPNAPVGGNSKWDGVKRWGNLGLGVGSGALLGVGTGMSIYNDDDITMGDYVGYGLAGATAGALIGGAIGSFGGPIGTYLGANAGAKLGAMGATLAVGGTALRDVTNPKQHNQGGILINSPFRMGNNVFGDGQNGTQKEAVIPLSSDRGKSMMEINLSDSSIDKMLQGFKKMNIPINIVINNNTDRDRMQFNQMANLSSNLTF